MTTKVAEDDKIPYDPDKFVSNVPEDRQDLQKKLVKKVKNRFEEYGSAINGLIDSEHDRLHDIDSPDDHNGVSGATENNFMSFDANGLPQDSGHKDADYADAIHASQHKSGGGDELYCMHRYTWYFPGDCEVKTNEVIHRISPYYAEYIIDNDAVQLTVNIGNDPSGSSLIIDIKLNGVTIFTTKPEIDIGGTTEDGNQVFSTTTLTKDGTLTCEITQIGSGDPGTELTVHLTTKEIVV
jgi:hypothetical protein